MKQTRIIMGMPITLRIDDAKLNPRHFNVVFNYFRYVDKKFSTYKEDSEVSLLNKGLIKESEVSKDLKEVLALSEKTNKDTEGYFDIHKGGKIDPSGLVKGWSIKKAFEILRKFGYKNYYVDAGGDIQASDRNGDSKPWRVGIRNPYNRREVVKVLRISDAGVATSGTYIRGTHIYNPKKNNEKADEILSLTVVAKDIYDADRFATAAFAMGRKGIYFIEKQPGVEGFMIDKKGVGTETTGFRKYLL